MRFEVKVGRAVDGEVVVTIDESDKKSFLKTLKEMAVKVVAISILGGVAATVFYGILTGDYSFLRRIAEAAGVAISAAAKTSANGK